MSNSQRTDFVERKRGLFLVITLMLPWVALALLELGLRVGGYGSDFPLFSRSPGHSEYLVANPDVARRYFAGGAFVPTPQLDFFRAVKQPGTFRIVFQGESSAIGFPYVHGGAPSRMLEQRLQATFPDRNIEIINTALTAVNSYTLLDFADEIIAQRPDAIMIYTGHNEYYGAFGAGSATTIAGSRPLVRSYLTLRKLRIVQLISNVLERARAAAPSNASASSPRTVMELMAGEQRIPFRSTRYNAGLDQFRANLGALLQRYRSRNIPVFIGTVASNERDQRPFIGATADSLYSEARRADLNRDYPRASALYRTAKDMDELRFRAPEAINAIIRETARVHGARVVETEKALQSASPEGIIGQTLMLEHLHPNVTGYFIIADAFFDALRETRMIGAWNNAPSAADARAMVPVTAVDSLAGVFHTDRLKSGWPFQPRGKGRTPAVDTLHPRTIEEDLARRLVLGEMSWPEAMDRLRVAYEQAGEFDRAVRVALTMAQEYRYSAKPYMDAARIEIGRRRYDAALHYVLAATKREENANSVQLAGLLLLRRGDEPDGVRYLERAAELAPGEQRMVVSLRAARAIPDLEQGRAQNPRDTTILYTLAGAYALTQQYEKSREALAALQRVAPNHAGGRALLQRLPKQ